MIWKLSLTLRISECFPRSSWLAPKSSCFPQIGNRTSLWSWECNLWITWILSSSFFFLECYKNFVIRSPGLPKQSQKAIWLISIELNTAVHQRLSWGSPPLPTVQLYMNLEEDKLNGKEVWNMCIIRTYFVIYIFKCIHNILTEV